jgi:hypothetical protein
MEITRRDLLTGSIGAIGAGGLGLAAYVSTRPSQVNAASKAKFTVDGAWRNVYSNGIPEHEMGDFPNPHNPIGVKPQSHKLRMPTEPVISDEPIPLNMWWFGVALNGIPLDPSGPHWAGDVTSGWQFEVLHPGNSIALGIDPNNGHTQAGGMYHYHGLPDGLLTQLTSKDPLSVMQLVGYAADGHPIYGPECPGDANDLASPKRRLRASYRLADKRRSGGPGGKPDGRFVEDHIYEPEYGDLDECNGRRGPTPEYPEGLYYYVLTDGFPFIPRFYRGIPDASFEHGPPPGRSAPIPAELRGYRASG